MLTGKHIALSGAILGAIAVAAGAFGAHALRGELTPDRMETYKTAVSYLQWHVLAIILTGYLLHQSKERMFKLAAGAFLAGTLLFSGSLFILVLTDTPIMGAVAPFGGVFLIAAWCLMAVGIKKSF